MTHPLRENLELYADSTGSRIRCAHCFHVLCGAEEDWRRACKRKLSPPTHAGPLMESLSGHFVLEQLCCPACGVLLNTDLVADPGKKTKTNRKARQNRI